MAQYELNLRDYWWIIRKKKFVIVLSTLMLGSFSFIFAYSRKPVPVFETSASLKYEKPVSGGMAFAQYTQAGGGDLATHTELIKSYNTIELAAKRMAWINPNLSSEEVRNDEELMIMIRDLKEKVETEQEGYTMIINIIVTSPLDYPITTTKDLADFTNALGIAYAEWDIATKKRGYSRSQEFLWEQLSDARRKNQIAARNVQRFREENKFVTLDGVASGLFSELTTARREYERLQENRKQIESLIDAAKRDRSLLYVGSVELFMDIRNPIITSYKDQLIELRANRDELLLTYTEKYPSIIEIDSSMSIMEQKILNEMELFHNSLIREETSQKTSLDKLEQDYHKLPGLAVQLDEKEQELAFAEDAYISLTESWQESRLTEQQLTSDLVLARPAFPPEDPINTVTTKATAIVGTIIGLILGMVFAFVAETLDTSIGTIEDVEAFLDTTVLGVIPFVKPEEAKQRIRKRRPEIVDDDILEMQARLVSQFDPKSSLAESYRALRTNLQFVGIEKKSKAIVFTSSSAQEGKTTLATNLAITMAQIGNRTLLIEADLRKPGISKIFGIDREPGLTEIILGVADWHDAVRTLTDIMMGRMPVEEFLATPGMDNLNIITSGRIPPNPSEISNSNQMSEFINQVKEEYDLVVVDTPPVLQTSDAALLSSKVDGVVLVYKVGKVARGALKRAKAQLENVKASILGVVLNGLKAEISRDYSAYNYGTYYSYGAEAEAGGFFLVRWIKKLLRKIPKRTKARAEIIEEHKPEEESFGAEGKIRGFFLVKWIKKLLRGIRGEEPKKSNEKSLGD